MVRWGMVFHSMVGGNGMGMMRRGVFRVMVGMGVLVCDGGHLWGWICRAAKRWEVAGHRGECDGFAGVRVRPAKHGRSGGGGWGGGGVGGGGGWGGAAGAVGGELGRGPVGEGGKGGGAVGIRKNTLETGSL